MKVSGTLKGKRIANAAWIVMIFEIMSQLLDKLVLGSFSMSKLVRDTWRRSHKVAKVRIERIVDKGNENIWAQAWGRSSLSALFVQNNGCGGLERVKFVHPSSRLGVLVCQDVRHLRSSISTNAVACSSSKTIANRVVQKNVSIEVGAGGRMESKRIP
jgi:hypothetical protein